ncbi:MAG: ATP-binding cassette domain-containing protein [Firmicutes bacterium]|nr:ATP-binding cassette domain-containing protein [Bacillota bacterium]
MLSVSVSHPAIRGTFVVHQGLIAVVGLSGAGKTTLFRALSGLLPVPAEMAWEGERFDHRPPHQRPLAYVPQHPSLVPHKTIAAQVRWVQAASDADVESWRRMLALDALWHRYPRELSGGEQQRAALLRALAANRPLLILDESLSNVDKPHRDEIFGALARTWKNRLLLFSTHDWREAETWADGVLYIERGTLYPVQERYRVAPLTPTMARLMGFLGSVRDADGQEWLLHPRLVKPGRHPSGHFVPGRLTVTALDPMQSHYRFESSAGVMEWGGEPWPSGLYDGLTLTFGYAATGLDPAFKEGIS